MKKMSFILLFVPFLLNAQTAKIKIDIDRTIGEIDPKIYGVFMEPIHFNGRRLGFLIQQNSIHFMGTYTILLRRLRMRMDSGKIILMQ